MQPISNSRKPQLYVLVGVALIAIVWVVSFRVISFERDLEYKNGVARVERLATFFDRQTLRILRYADSYLKSARHEFIDHGGLKSLRHYMDEVNLDRSMVSHITVIDAGGRPIFNSEYPLKPGISANDRAYFKAVKSQAADQVYISEPRRGRNSGKVLFRLVRSIRDAEGRFLGVIFAAIETLPITAFFASADVGAGGNVALIGLDKAVRAQSTDAGSEAINSSRLWQEFAAKPNGMFETTSATDGITKLVVYRKLGGYPLITAVSVPSFGLSGHSKVFEKFVLAIGFLATLIILAMTTIIYREIRVGRRIQASERRLVDAIESLSDAFIYFDADEKLVVYNTRYTEFFPWVINDLEPGTTLTELMQSSAEGKFSELPQTDEETWIEERLQLYRVGAAGREERLPDGRWILSSDHRTHDGGIVGIRTDITALKESQNRLLDAIESISDGFVYYDSNLKLVLCNSKYKEFYPWVADLLESGTDLPTIARISAERGQDMAAIADIDGWVKDRLNLFREGRVGHEQHLQSGRWLLCSEYRTGDGGFVGIRTDITDRKNYETELARHRDKLQDMVDEQTRDLIAARDESERANAAKSEFLSSMSHELRTPLNAILGFSQLLKINTSEPLTAKQQKSINQILTSGELLLGLIEEILDLSKIETGQLEVSLLPVQPDVILNESVAMAQAMAGGRDVVVSEFARDPSRPQILIDPTRFKQVILNLLSNAVKYNRTGGTVDVDCETRPEAIRISVVDTGPGIPEDRHQDLFQPFQRLGREASDIEGTGIGLTITKHLVELMGGDLDFSTEPGAGSTFWVEFPVAGTGISDSPNTAKASAVEISAPEKEITDHNSQTHDEANAKAPFKVLYFEDNAANLALVSAMLDEFDQINLSHAHTGEIGMEIAMATPPDLILMDINLPGMSGIDALHRLRESDTTLDVPVIAVSADAIPDHVDAALEMGFYGYLVKPFNVHEALELIFAALNSSTKPAAKG